MKIMNNLEVITNKISHVCKKFNCLDEMYLDCTKSEYFGDAEFQPTNVIVQVLHELKPTEQVMFGRIQKWLTKYNRRHNTNYTFEVEF